MKGLEFFVLPYFLTCAISHEINPAISGIHILITLLQITPQYILTLSQSIHNFQAPNLSIM